MALSLSGVKFSGRTSAGSGDPIDPYWSDVVVLLQGEGATIVDSSSYNLTPYQEVGVATSATQQKFGSKSIEFSGSTARLSYRNTLIDSTFGAGAGTISTPFTVEGFFYVTSNGVMITTYNHASMTGWQLQQFFGTFRLMNYNGGGSTLIDSGSAFPTNVWTYLTITFDGTTTNLFINGISVGTTTTLLRFAATPRGIGFGNNFVGNVDSAFSGFLDSARVTIGEARYTSNFTPPTAPFPTS